MCALCAVPNTQGTGRLVETRQASTRRSRVKSAGVLDDREVLLRCEVSDIFQCVSTISSRELIIRSYQGRGKSGLAGTGLRRAGRAGEAQVCAPRGPPGACTRVPRAEACPAGSACIPEPMGPVPGSPRALLLLVCSHDQRVLDVRCEAQVCAPTATSMA